jgi:hypothetical protein
LAYGVISNAIPINGLQFLDFFGKGVADPLMSAIMMAKKGWWCMTDVYYDLGPDDKNCDRIEMKIDSETLVMIFTKIWNDGRQSETIIKEPKNVSKGS